MKVFHGREAPLAWLSRVAIRAPQRPRVAIELGPTVRTWALRAACAGAAASCVLLVTSVIGHWVVAAAIIVALTAWPSSGAPSAFVVGVGLLVLTSPAAPTHPRLFLLVFGVHLTLELAAVLGDLPWVARVELRALRGFAARFLAIQLISQMIAFVGVSMPHSQSSVAWLPLAAGTALALLSWGLFVRMRAG